MKSRLLIFIVPLLVLVCLSPANSQNAGAELLLTAKSVKFDKRELIIEFDLENRTASGIFVATDPKAVNGKAGYYVLAERNDKSLLKISSRVYAPNPYTTPYTDSRRVELKKLNAGEKITQIVAIKFPASETDPPYYLDKKRVFSASEIETIELTVGYFIEEEGILDFLKRKPFGWFIKGEESFDSGKHKNQSFLEIQRLVSTSIEKTALK